MDSNTYQLTNVLSSIEVAVKKMHDEMIVLLKEILTAVQEKEKLKK